MAQPPHDRSQASTSRPAVDVVQGESRGARMGSGSFRDLFQDIIAGVEQIIRSEIRLARTEIKDDVIAAGRGAGMLAAGGVLALLAAVFLLLAVVYALSKLLPDWLAAFIVSAGVAAAAGVLAKAGIERIRTVNPAPEQTIDSLKEDMQWVRRQTR